MDSFVGLVAIEDFELVGIELQELGEGNMAKGREGSSTWPRLVGGVGMSFGMLRAVVVREEWIAVATARHAWSVETNSG
jgi:hypothetical protein